MFDYKCHSAQMSVANAFYYGGVFLYGMFLEQTNMLRVRTFRRVRDTYLIYMNTYLIYMNTCLIYMNTCKVSRRLFVSELN